MPQTIAELFILERIIVYLCFALGNTVLLMFASGKFFLAMQQLGYKGAKYNKWVNSWKNSYMQRLTLLSLLGTLFCCLLNVCFSSVFSIYRTGYIGFLAYFIFMMVYINSESHVNKKRPLKMTKRLLRLSLTTVILFFALTFGLMLVADIICVSIHDSTLYSLRYFVVCLSPIFMPVAIFLANLINYPFEKINNNRYVRRTKAQLASSNIIKIGITGSYGKTSVKNILSTILSQKYRVLVTPESYNTPLGISLSVKKLDPTHDIFIAEMGARSKGDIADLARIVKPQYALLTGVNAQHLETFITEENIKSTKFELFESLDAQGKGFFSADNEGAMELYEKFEGNKYSAGMNGSFVKAENLSVSEHGATFDLVFNGKNKIKCQTNLLGKHNISNICLASAVAYEIGMTPKEIAMGINRLVAIKHRLELIRNNKNILIIDDSYNSNEHGVKAALEVLSLFEGRKFIVTPGLVELGSRENMANFEFGKTISSVADVVVIVGKHNAEMLIQGLLKAGFNKANIVFAKNRNKAGEKLNELLVSGDVVLFENDLPDTYE